MALLSSSRPAWRRTAAVVYSRALSTAAGSAAASSSSPSAAKGSNSSSGSAFKVGDASSEPVVPRGGGGSALAAYRERAKAVPSATLAERADTFGAVDDISRLSDQAAPIDLPFEREASILRGTTEFTRGRVARILHAAQHPMSSRSDCTRHWYIQFDRCNDWGNPLMGWESSNDTLDQLREKLVFKTEKEAIYFCERNGYPWELDEETPQKAGDLVDNVYDYNILPRSVKHQLSERGAEKGRHIFHSSTAHRPCWMNLKRSSYGPDAWKPAAARSAAAVPEPQADKAKPNKQAPPRSSTTKKTQTKRTTKGKRS